MNNLQESRTQVINVENLIEINNKIDKNDKNFERLMFIYSLAIREIEHKMNIIKDEFKYFYEYDMIDNMKTRIKSYDSIIKKMNNKKINMTYKSMIENVNDIAGVRIVCPLKKDIYTIRNIVETIPGIEIKKEKDYVAEPKKSGYASYHLVLEVPICLSQMRIMVKLEIQIRTVTMDFWSNLEHKMKYKVEDEDKKIANKDWEKCAKVLAKLDDKMLKMV